MTETTNTAPAPERMTAAERVVMDGGGRLNEVDPTAGVPAHEIFVIQPYGSLFFADGLRPALRPHRDPKQHRTGKPTN